MIPLWDINATRKRPLVTYALFAANLAVFVYMALLPDQSAELFVHRFALVPAVLTEGELTLPRSEGGALGALVTPITSMFLHGNGVHIAGNLLFLHVFGDNVEDVLGRARFAVFYLGCGLVAAVAQMLVGPDSTTPMVGASGAISGVLAAYVVLFPGARVVTLTPLFFLLDVPAGLFIVVWFALQLLSGLTSLGDVTAGGGGVAWFAHLGGFVAGIVLMKTWLASHRAPAVRELRKPPRPPWAR